METMSERIARIYIAKQKDQGLPKKYLSGFKGKERTERTKEIKKRQNETDTKKLYKPFKSDADAKTRPSKYSKTEVAEKIREELNGTSKKDYLAAASKVSGVKKSILEQVWDRGLKAWTTGHRPGATAQQWAIARIYSFLSGGKTQSTADKDLAEEAGLI